MIRLIGNHVSPYARKALVVLAMKGIEHEVDPIVPFFGTDAFASISPLRRIPVLIDGDIVLNDSTVIAEYLDEAYPDPPMMPATPRDRARARWIEEFADTRLADVILWRIFYQRIIQPSVFREPTDDAVVADAIDTQLPPLLDWLEGEAPASGFLFGHPCIADIAVAGVFRNATLAGHEPDPTRWPRLTAWLSAVAEIPEFARSIGYESVMLTTRRRDQRDALRAAGLRVSETTLGGPGPRHGVMRLG